MPVESFGGYRRNDDYLRDVARGGVPGASHYSAFGEHVATGASSGVVWPNGTYAFPPEAGLQLSVVSTSVDDAAGGTGARTIDIHGLDANLNEVEERVTLNGTTSVLTTRTDWRFVQCMHIESWGAGAKAAGTISASNAGQTYSQISTGRVRCSSSVRMVPKGKRVMVFAMFAGSVSGTATARTLVRLSSPNFMEHDYIQANVFFPIASGSFQDSSAGIALVCPAPFTEGQVIGMTFETDKAATITGSWFGHIEDE